MKTLIITILLLTSSLAFAGELQEIDNKIRDLQSTVDSLQHSVRIRIEQRKVRFPKYNTVFEKLLENVSTASKNYKRSLKEIRDQLEDGLSDLYTKRSSLNKQYKGFKCNKWKNRRKHLCRALKSLRKDNDKRFNSAKKALLKTTKKKYRVAISNFMGLDGKFRFPATRRIHPNVLKHVGISFLNILPIGFGSVFYLMARYKGSNKERYKYGFIIKNNDGSILGNHLKRKVQTSARKASAKKIFSGCKTAGCVYLLSEDLKYWAKLSRKVNRSVKLTKKIKLKKVCLPFKWQINRAMRKMAKYAAKKLPIANFK